MSPWTYVVIVIFGAAAVLGVIFVGVEIWRFDVDEHPHIMPCGYTRPDDVEQLGDDTDKTDP